MVIKRIIISMIRKQKNYLNTCFRYYISDHLLYLKFFSLKRIPYCVVILIIALGQYVQYTISIILILLYSYFICRKFLVYEWSLRCNSIYNFTFNLPLRCPDFLSFFIENVSYVPWSQSSNTHDLWSSFMVFSAKPWFCPVSK